MKDKSKLWYALNDKGGVVTVESSFDEGRRCHEDLFGKAIYRRKQEDRLIYRVSAGEGTNRGWVGHDGFSGILLTDDQVPAAIRAHATLQPEGIGGNELYAAIKALAQRLADTGEVRNIASRAYDCSAGDEPYNEITSALDAIEALALKLEKA